MPKAKQTLKPKEVSQSVGYGFSQILNDLLTALDRPITNSDEFRNYYKQMLSNDETIGTGLEYLTGRIVSRIGAYSHEDKKIKDLVDASIESVRGTLTEVRRSILRDSFVYGYGVGEFTIKSVNSQWLLSSIQILEPTTIQFRMGQFEDKSYGIDAVIQKAGMTEVEIPAKKCIIKTYGDSTTPYGKSLLRRCYRWWSFKKAIPKLWAVALERFSTPMLHGMTDSREDRKKLDALFSNIYANPYITTDTKAKIEAIFTPNSAIGTSYQTAIEACDKMMYRAMFLPSLLGSGENGGSYSLGQVHFELFNSTAAALAEDYIDVELEQLWRPLIEWNFGEQENYGDFAINDTTPISEKVAMSGMLMNLAQVGMLAPESDTNWVREMLGLPELKEGEIKPRWELENEETQPDGSQEETL